MVKLLLEFVEGKSPEEVTIKLSEKPYAVRVRGHHGDPDHKRRYVFSYHQIDTDFHQLLTWDCRGTILECEISQTDGEIEYLWSPVAVPFRKFFNAREKYNKHIPDGFDWSTAEVFPKEDGSLLKLYNYEGKWCWGTNNGICAESASLSDAVKTCTKYRSFQDLIDEVAHEIPKEELNPDHTYLFELVSPYNTVVVNTYDKINLILLAVHCNRTFQEQPRLEHPKVKTVLPLNLEKDLEALSFEVTKRPGTEFEGFVVKDSRGFRLKIKNPEYVMLHHTKSRTDQIPGEFLVLAGWLKGELDEILAVRPNLEEKAKEVVPMFEKYMNAMLDFEDRLREKFGRGKDKLISLDTFSKKERGEFAKVVKDSPTPSLFFALYTEKLKNHTGTPYTNVESYLRAQTGIEESKALYKKIVSYF